MLDWNLGDVKLNSFSLWGASRFQPGNQSRGDLKHREWMAWVVKAP